MIRVLQIRSLNWIFATVFATVLGLLAWPATGFAAADAAEQRIGINHPATHPTGRNVPVAAPMVVAQAATATPASLTAPIGLISSTAAITPTVTISPTRTASPTATPTARRTSVVTTQVIPGLSPTPTPVPANDEEDSATEDNTDEDSADEDSADEDSADE
ncbi:MAG: hypothetical protein WDZ49_09145, partial [Litorilinea sp.]